MHYFGELFKLDFYLGEIFNLSSIVFYLIAVLFLIIAKWVYDITTPFKLEKNLLDDDNKAIAVSFSGYFLAVGIIIASVLSDQSNLSLEGWQYSDVTFFGALKSKAFLRDLISSSIWISCGIALLVLSGVINDRFILPSFSNRIEMTRDKNIGVGVCMLASYISSALIVRTLVTGSSISSSIVVEIAMLFIYYLAAQIALIVFAKLYRVTSNYDIDKAMEKDNIAAGLSLGCHCIAISLMLSHALLLSNSLIIFFLYFINGTVFLLATRWVCDRIFFRHASISKEITQDQNWGIALVEGIVVIAVALNLNSVFNPFF